MSGSGIGRFCTALALMLLAEAPGARAAEVMAADYARAEAVHELKAAALIYGNRPSYRWGADSATLLYTSNTAEGPRTWRIDAVTGRRTTAEPDPLPPAEPDTTLPSPDGRGAVFVRAHDLWVRDAGGAERRLTRDGEDHFAYGELPDELYKSIDRQTGRLKIAPFSVAWSPNGRTLFGQRTDERKVEPYPFVAWSPADGSPRPKTYFVRRALLGDAELPQRRPYLVDVASGAVRQVAAPEGWRLIAPSIQWSADGSRGWIPATSDDAHGGALFELDVAAATLRPVIVERRKAAFSFNMGSVYTSPNVRVLKGGREAIWFSERDGWGNLYLYDLASGRVQRQLTRGPGVVLDIVAVDEARRRVVFTAQGRGAGEDPYHRHLYSVGLDGGPIQALTPDTQDHELSGPIAPFFKIFFRTPPGLGALSPDGRWFVDAASTLESPPVVTLRSAITGRVVGELDRGDARAFEAKGWTAPKRFRVKAADGVTDIWGGVYFPPGYDPSRKYPVIDGLYAGSQVTVAPRNFNEGSGARAQMFDRNSLAALGFIVFTVDARGTPGRTSAFHDVSYGNFADPQLDDHVAALTQLAKLYPGMDLTRVGAYGHSLGGYVAARALLRYPDVYKVAVASAGPQAWEAFYAQSNADFGPPDYGDGRGVRPDTGAVPDAIRAVDNTPLAGRLKGKLLLAFGDLDENAPAGATLVLAAALEKAGKTFDLLYLPNTTHAYGTLNYFEKRLWDYFVTNLMPQPPPANAVIGRREPAQHPAS